MTQLALVQPEPPIPEPEGKRVCDELRAEIGKRDWAAVHIAADRRAPIVLPEKVRKDLAGMRVGKKIAGRLLDGVEHNGYPAMTVQRRRLDHVRAEFG